MFRILNGLTASLMLGGVLAVSSVGFAQDKSTSQPQGSMGGMMQGGTMMPGGGMSRMSSDDMQKMMTRCQEMMKGDSTPGASNAPSTGGTQMSGDMQQMHDNCMKMMNSSSGSSPAPTEKK
jgi:hypothetical protein